MLCKSIISTSLALWIILIFISIGFCEGNDSYTVLLIHSDTFDGDTTFIDSSDSEYLPVSTGNTSHVSSKSKFGATSIYFDGVNDSITVPTSSGFFLGVDDFTIDFWLNPSRCDDNSEQYIGFAPYGVFDIYRIRTGLRSGTVELRINGIIYETNYRPTNIGNWIHFAFVRQGTNITLFVNGQNTDTISIPNNLNIIPSGSNTIYIGLNEGGASDLYGYMDEIRISKGIARWTSNFIPPSSPYTKTTNDDTVAQIFQSSNYSGQAINDSEPVAIAFDSEDLMGSEFQFEPICHPTKLFITSSGIYQVTYSINWKTDDDYRKNIKTFLRKNDTDDIERTTSYSYARHLENANGTNHCLFFTALEAGDYIEVMCEQAGSSGSATTIPGESWLTIKKIK